jgi:hypothetical protein
MGERREKLKSVLDEVTKMKASFDRVAGARKKKTPAPSPATAPAPDKKDQDTLEGLASAEVSLNLDTRNNTLKFGVVGSRRGW